MSQDIASRLSRIPGIGHPLARVAEHATHSLLLARQSHRERANSKARAAGEAATPYPERLHEHWARIMDRSSSLRNTHPKKAPASGGVLFFPVWGTGTAITTKAIEIVLAHALRLRGIEVGVVGCNRALPACLIDSAGNHEALSSIDGLRTSFTASTCRHCVRSLDALYDDSLVPALSLSTSATPTHLRNAIATVAQLATADYSTFQYKGVAVGQHALASAFRVTGRGTLLAIPEHNQILARQLIGSIVAVDATDHVLDLYKPRRIALTHGIYVDHGTIAETARRRGIPVVVFVRPYRKATVMLCHQDTYHRALVTEPTDLWEHRILSPSEREKLLQYVDSRRHGSMDSVTYHPNPIEGVARVLEELRLDPAKPTITAFTNVMWDAQLYHASNAFPNMLEWIFETIRYFARKPGIQLVVRVHPAEVKATKRSEQPVAAEIQREFPNLPANVRIVGPESDLSSYDLAEASRASIVYGTKMALEIALRGLPVIVAGESFVRGKGFTFDASNAAEYYSILEGAQEFQRLSPDQLERAIHYGYHFYFRRQIDFPYFTEGNRRGEVGFGFESLADLLPGKDPNLDLICEGLIHGSEFITP